VKADTRPGAGSHGKRALRFSPAAKVAAVAAGLLAVVYVIAVIVLNLLVSAHLSEKSEARLISQLAAVRSDQSLITRPASGPGAAREPDDLDSDSAPVYLWAAMKLGASGAGMFSWPSSTPLAVTV